METDKTQSILNLPDGELILMCAFGYALGRKTYVVSTVVDLIIREWPNLKPFLKKFFRDDINKAIQTGYAGMNMDVAQWQRILDL